MRRILTLLLCLMGIVWAQTMPHTLPDFAGDGVAHSVAAYMASQGQQNPGSVRWIQFVTPSGNANLVTVGDANISATQGIHIAAGGAYITPQANGSSGDSNLFTSTGAWYFLVQPQDKVSILWGR